MGNVAKRPDGRWRARYRDGDGKEHARHFELKRDAQRWVEGQEEDLRRGEHVDPKVRKTTVQAWASQWLTNYEGSGRVRSETVRDARTHLKRITAHLGRKRMTAVTPADIRSMIAANREAGLAATTLYQLHLRTGQLFGDAVHDGIIKKSPVSRRTSPGVAAQRVFVPTEDQIWGFYDELHHNVRPAILLGAFAGLRTGEVVALRVEDIDQEQHVIRVQRQHQEDREVKTEMSKTPIPISADLLKLLDLDGLDPSDHVVTGTWGRRISGYTFEEFMRNVRDGGRPQDGETDERLPWKRELPEDFRFHDFRHYFASLLISEGLDVKSVQNCLRHKSATTTLNVYGHMFPDRNDAARAAFSRALENMAADFAITT